MLSNYVSIVTFRQRKVLADTRMIIFCSMRVTVNEVDSAEKKFHNYIATLLSNYIVTEIFFLFLVTNKPLSLPCLHTYKWRWAAN